MSSSMCIGTSSTWEEFEWTDEKAMDDTQALDTPPLEQVEEGNDDFVRLPRLLCKRDSTGMDTLSNAGSTDHDCPLPSTQPNGTYNTDNRFEPPCPRPDCQATAHSHFCNPPGLFVRMLLFGEPFNRCVCVSVRVNVLLILSGVTPVSLSARAGLWEPPTKGHAQSVSTSAILDARVRGWAPPPEGYASKCLCETQPWCAS